MAGASVSRKPSLDGATTTRPWRSTEYIGRPSLSVKASTVSTPPGDDARAWFGAVWARTPVAPNARIDTPPRARKDLRCIMGTPLRRLLPTAANGG